MKLTSYIAQSIVNRTMKLLNYNINIMDEHGIIIGSGDKQRLNTFHQVAAEVIKDNRPIAVSKNIANKYKGCQEGLNLPICLNHKPLGVVGITGNPEEVKTYSRLVQAMAELMLEENLYWEQINAEEQAKFLLITDLVGQNPECKEELLNTRSELLGYNLNLTRAVFVFELNELELNPVTLTENKYLKNTAEDQGFLDLLSRKKINRLIDKTPRNAQDLYASGIQGKHVFIKALEGDNSDEISMFLTSLVEMFRNECFNITIGVGTKCNTYIEIPNSFSKALHALRIGKIFYGTGNIYYGDKLILEASISKMGKEIRNNYIHEVFNELIYEKEDIIFKLLETIQVYFDCNLKMKEAAERLFIHRNTLAYRISGFNKLTGLDLSKLDDIVKAKFALMCWNYDHVTNKEYLQNNF